MSEDSFDFDDAVRDVLDGLGSGPHCSCAEVVMEIVRHRLPLRCEVARCSAAAFGGGVGGSGGPCGAFSAGLIALGMWVGENLQLEGCISEVIADASAAYFDSWMERFGSVMCATLTGYPRLRTDEAREAFVEGGGAQRCTDGCIRAAVESVMLLTEQHWPASQRQVPLP